MRIVPLAGPVATTLLCLGYASPTPAQTDEIQVYDAGIVPPGAFNLTLHNNFTPSGNTAATFPGGIVPEHSLNGVAEWAYGIAAAPCPGDRRRIAGMRDGDEATCTAKPTAFL